jgi:hypothetical protein
VSRHGGAESVGDWGEKLTREARLIGGARGNEITF